MELKPGYKQTEVGVIPQDWDDPILQGYVDIKSGESPSKYEFTGQGVPYFKVEQLNSGTKYVEISPYMFKEGPTVPAGSIVFPKRGASILLNKIRIFKCDAFMDTNLMSLTVKNGLMNEYLYYCLDYQGLSKIADTTSIPQINNKHIYPFRIPLPPTKEEQTTIAGALSDADGLITALERLITKKWQIKQGAMQTLLNPHDENGRLKAGWEVKTLGEIAEFKKGKGLPKKDIQEYGKYECIHYGELFTKYGEYIQHVESYTNCSDNPVVSKSNDVFMPTSDVTPNGLATASCIKKDGVILGGDVLVIRCDDKVLDGIYFAYVVKFEREKVMQLVSGTTVFHLYGSDMAKLEFSMPSDINEQTRIATILSDMGAEINALEAKLAKARAVKQGMMQNLLTGRIRLV